MIDMCSPKPHAAIIDSQTTRTHECGYDGGKQISGRKRDLAVDTQGQILLVLGADVHDHCAAEAVLADLRGRYPEVKCLWPVWTIRV